MIYWRQSYICLLFSLASLSLLGQHGAGVKIGVDFNKNISLFNSINIGDSLILNSFLPKREGNMGMWLNLSHDNLYLQTEFLIARTEERYQVNFLNTGNNNPIVSDYRLFLDLPLLAGVNLEPLSFYGGIAPRISLNTPQKLSEWFDIERQGSRIYLKYILGASLDLGSMRVDFRYNNQFLNKVDIMTVNDVTTRPINHLERFSFSVSFDLFRE